MIYNFSEFVFENNYGWRSGDLKRKAETLDNFRGGRGTGHFGTGFYFFGTEEMANRYDNREVSKLDFSKYNLYKPLNFEHGISLHKALSNTQILDLKYFLDTISNIKIEKKYKFKKNYFGSVYFEDSYLDKLTSEKTNYLLKYLTPEILDSINNNFEQEPEYFLSFYVKKDIEKFFEKLMIIKNKFTNKEEIADGEWRSDKFKIDIEYDLDKKIDLNLKDIFLNHMINEIEELINDKSNKNDLYKEYAKPIIDELSDVISKNSPLSNNEIKEIFNKKLYSIIRRNPYIDSHKDKTTISTELMKSLGYDGIDVRHIKDLDNPTFGSVIYDIKESKEYNKCEFLKNEDGSKKVFYHGTNNKFDDFKYIKSRRTILMSLIEVETKAFFFTESEEKAKEYGDIIIAANLKFSKMAQDYPKEVFDIIKKVYKDNVETSTGVVHFDDYTHEDNLIKALITKEEGLDWMLLDDDEFVDELKRAGFDGTIVYEDYDEISIAAFYNRNIVKL